MNLRSNTDLEALNARSSYREAVQSILNSTVCFDLMETSAKAVVFETNIPFQLAFYALVEHDAIIAPLWDPDRRIFVGMMAISDFIHMLKLSHRQNIPQIDLASKSIAEMLTSPLRVFKHSDFQTVDAEDTVHQLCGVLHRLGTDYVPVADPDEGNLVAILGYLDLVHLLHEACRQYPQFFSSSVEQMHIGTFESVATAPSSMLLFDALDLMEARNISGLPVTDDAGMVIGLYHRSDVSFITKAVDPDAAIQSLHSLQVGEALKMQQSTISETSALHSNQVLCICSQKDSLVSVLDVMMRSQVTRVVCVDVSGRCAGVVSIKDIIGFYFDQTVNGH